jgi:Ca2+/Na+ antiporter
MNPFIRRIFERPSTQKEPLPDEKKEQPLLFEVTQDEETATRETEKKAGVFEWIWFISWGLLIPMLFYLFYGIVGLLVGLALFAIYLFLVYISVKPENERQGLEEKATRIQDYLDRRAEDFSRVNKQTVDAVQRTVVRNIPGFRTRTPWKMIAATAFYLLTILVLLIAVQQGSFALAMILGLTALLFISGTQDEMS